MNEEELREQNDDVIGPEEENPNWAARESDGRTFGGDGGLGGVTAGGNEVGDEAEGGAAGGSGGDARQRQDKLTRQTYQPMPRTNRETQQRTKSIWRS